MTKKYPLFLSATALVLGLSGQAMAAEQFQGFYVGAGAGYGTHTYESSRSDIGDSDFGTDGLEGRLYGGYGHLAGRLYMGLEADVGLSSGKTKSNSYLTDGVFTQEVENEFKRDLNYGVDAMLGYLVAERLLVYGKVGYERANFEYDSTVGTAGAAGGGGSMSGDKDMNGIRLGVGVGVGLTDSLTARLEYRGTFYTDDFNIQYTSANTTIDEKIDPTVHTFTVNLQYQF